MAENAPFRLPPVTTGTRAGAIFARFRGLTYRTVSHPQPILKRNPHKYDGQALFDRLIIACGRSDFRTGRWPGKNH